MAEPTQYSFNYKEMAEILIKHQGIHEGLWQVYFKFGIQAANMAFNDASNYLPTAMIPILEVGIQKSEKEAPLTVDAAKINPKKSKKSTK